LRVGVVPTTAALILDGSTKSQFEKKEHHDGRRAEHDGC